MCSKINVLSLFDGISCTRIALGDNFEGNYYASEINKKCIDLVKKRYPKTISLGNVVELDTECLKTLDITLLIGGSPCQDLSSAGKRKGLNGERSSLFYEFVKILKAICPKYFLLENVASMSKENKNIISKEIGCEPVCINSGIFTAQNRLRLYWTNIPIEGVDKILHRNLTLIDMIRCKTAYSFYKTYTKNPTTGEKYIIKNRRWDGKTGTITSWNKDNSVCVDGVDRAHTLDELETLQGIPVGYTKDVGMYARERHLSIANAFTVPVIKWILTFIV